MREFERFAPLPDGSARITMVGAAGLQLWERQRRGHLRGTAHASDERSRLRCGPFRRLLWCSRWHPSLDP